MAHTSVLLQEILTGLDIKSNDIFFDGTINGGGHSFAVSEKLGAEGTIIGTDLDGNAIVKAGERLKGAKAKVILKQASFRTIDFVLAYASVPKVNKILLDLGLSSNQFDESGRGFSFQKDEPLLMTFNNKPGESDLTAEGIVNHWDEENIAQIIESYGEDRFAKKIAHAIVFARQRGEIKTTTELVEIIKSALPGKELHKRLHPATKTFQALRITVNDELGALNEGLKKGFEHLTACGRMAVISFHSLEDRAVKNFFKQMASEEKAVIITKRPLVATEQEIIENPRSRSAKLRIIEKK
ncbi:MAG: 16S rRNA (cytosine(1402)-N(4))-methyltransferase RsmH [Patescibacteria group bacterium]